MQFETAPGEQPQVARRSAYLAPTGGTRRVWAFTMVLSWSRMLYLEFVLSSRSTYGVVRFAKIDLTLRRKIM